MEDFTMFSEAEENLFINIIENERVIYLVVE